MTRTRRRRSTERRAWQAARRLARVLVAFAILAKVLLGLHGALAESHAPEHVSVTSASPTGTSASQGELLTHECPPMCPSCGCVHLPFVVPSVPDTVGLPVLAALAPVASDISRRGEGIAHRLDRPPRA